MNWEMIGYSLACVIVPVAWGLIIVWISNRLDQRLLRGGTRSREHPIEYHI